jgi:hypothetical protein
MSGIGVPHLTKATGAASFMHCGAPLFGFYSSGLTTVATVDFIHVEVTPYNFIYSYATVTTATISFVLRVYPRHITVPDRRTDNRVANSTFQPSKTSEPVVVTNTHISLLKRLLAIRPDGLPYHPLN